MSLMCQTKKGLIILLTSSMHTRQGMLWSRYTKKILVEEGHSMNHLTHIWQLVVRHEQLFYTSR